MVPAYGKTSRAYFSKDGTGSPAGVSAIQLISEKRQNLGISNFCRYDSPQWLGGLIVNGFEIFEPDSIVDLGSGSGVLAYEAQARWPTAQMVTVDLDRSTASSAREPGYFTNVPDVRLQRHVHADASRCSLLRKIRAAPATFDLVISNPPYSLVPWRAEFRTIMERAGLADALTTGRGAPLDIIFLAQALHMLRPGGKLAFVVPDSTISGARFNVLRRLLMESHGLDRVVQLPRRAFRGTDAQAFVIFLAKGKHSQHVRLDKISADGKWSTPLFVSTGLGAERLDYEYHTDRVLYEGMKSLHELGVEVTRGKACSRQVAASGGTIFHTCNFPKVTGDSVTLAGLGSTPFSDSKYASRGDILLARVDRRLEDKIAIVDQGAAEISDCIIRLRCSEEIRHRLLSGLINENGRLQLKRLSRGTGARHISLASIRTVRI